MKGCPAIAPYRASCCVESSPRPRRRRQIHKDMHGSAAQPTLRDFDFGVVGTPPDGCVAYHGHVSGIEGAQACIEIPKIAPCGFGVSQVAVGGRVQLPQSQKLLDISHAEPRKVERELLLT